jgi:hypothetical protein
VKKVGVEFCIRSNLELGGIKKDQVNQQMMILRQLTTAVSISGSIMKQKF